MKYIICIVVTLVFTNTLIAQEIRQTEQQPEKAVILPKELALAIAAYQPECPLKISYLEMRSYLNGGDRELIRVRNEGKAPIKSFTIAQATSLGIGSQFTMSDNLLDGMVLPGKEIMLGDPSRDQVIPFNEEIRKHLKLSAEMQFVSIFFVVKVVFADDSVYSDEKAYEALKLHFKKTSKCL